LVFSPKYRRAVINERVLSVLKAAFEQACSDFECELREVGWEADHVHLLVGYPPKVTHSRA
jgi:putative transposase